MVEQQIQRSAMDLQSENLEQKWKVFEENLISAAGETCGVTKTGGTKKRTKWWNYEIKDIIKTKKKLFK